jgi:hypothetical protein
MSKARVAEEVRVKRALAQIRGAVASYAKYMVASGAGSVLSEYSFYDTVQRVLWLHRYSVRCEYPHEKGQKGSKKRGPGDHKRIDFVAFSGSTGVGEVGLEIKFANRRPVSIRSDVDKLKSFIRKGSNRRGFVVVVGDRKHVEELKSDCSENMFGRITSIPSTGRCFSCVSFEVVVE